MLELPLDIYSASMSFIFELQCGIVRIYTCLKINTIAEDMDSMK